MRKKSVDRDGEEEEEEKKSFNIHLYIYFLRRHCALVDSVLAVVE